MTADLSLQFCAAQSVFGNGTTVQSTDWLDLGVARDLAGGRPVCVEIIVTTAFAGGTSAAFALQAVDSAGANPVVLDQTPTFPVASLVAGARILLRMSPKNALPASNLTALRLAVVNVGNNTAGAISAQLVPEASTQRGSKAVASGW